MKLEKGDKLLCKVDTHIHRANGKLVSYFKDKLYQIKAINLYTGDRTDYYYITGDEINIEETMAYENFYGFILDDLYNIFYTPNEIRKLKLDNLTKFH